MVYTLAIVQELQLSDFEETTIFLKELTSRSIAYTV